MTIEAFTISKIMLKICLFQSVYTLYASGYSSTGTDVGDEFSAQAGSYTHVGMAFSTFDNDNDNFAGVNCAADGGYWYDDCYDSSLNSLNLGAGSNHPWYKGIQWYPWINYQESAKSVYMAIQ